MPIDIPALSAILCTYNRAELLPRVLESLAAQTLDKDIFEVIVIDDGSTDASREIVQSFRAIPALRYSFQRNSGLASAKNHGIFLSRGPIVVFLDDDDILAPQLLEMHLETHRRYPAIQDAVLGFTDLVLDLASDPLMHYVTQVGCELFYYPGIRDGDCLDYTFFWGGRCSCKRELLIEGGIFDPTFRFGGEDIELGYRLSRIGLRVIYNKRAHSSMIRRIDFDGFCRRSYLQGQSQYVFSQLHPVPEIISWTEVNTANTEWETMQPVADYVFNYARDLDRIVRRRMVEQREIDKATIDLLHETYRTVFHLAKIQGMNHKRLELGDVPITCDGCKNTLVFPNLSAEGH